MHVIERMISYAQNAEDVVLARAFGDQDSGFFVDVGANEPTHDSVTRHFYDRGWSGVNIEPQAGCFANLERERPRDVNLNIGVGPEPGMLTLHVVPDAQAMSTFSAEQAESLHAMGYRTIARKVEVRTLDDVFTEHVGERVVDFLKVDVEGLEEGVLGTFDWSRWRPRSVVVESFPEVAPWEERLLANGYHRILWDGINLFFVRSEDLEEVGPKLRQPATIVLDRYDPWLYVEQMNAANKQVQPLLVDHLHRAIAARAKGADPGAVAAAAQALAAVLGRRPDVIDAFGAPPAEDLPKLLRWASSTRRRPDEPHTELLAAHSELYSRAANAPDRSSAGRLGRADLGGRLKAALPVGVRLRLGEWQRRLKGTA